MGERLTRTAAHAGMTLRAVAGRWPTLYVAAARARRGRNRNIAGPTTDLLVEGYPRSGNTFLVAWIARHAAPVEVASHVHHAAHVRYAVVRGIPSVVVLREPRAAVSSLAVMGGVPVTALIRRYERFHDDIAKLLPAVQIVTFEYLTRDPAGAVARIGERWGLELIAGESTPDAIAATFADIDELNRRRFGAYDPLATSRPTASRTAAIERVRAWLDDPEGQRELERSRRLYDELSSR